MSSTTGSAETSLYDVWLITKKRWKLVFGCPIAACLAILLTCTWLPEKYGYDMLVQLPQLTAPATLEKITIDTPRDVKEWLLFRYEDVAIGNAVGTMLKGVRIPLGANLVAVEVWAASLEKAKIGCNHIMNALQERYAHKIERFLKRQEAIVKAMEKEIGLQRSLHHKLANEDPGGMKRERHAVFSMEIDRILARIDQLSVGIEHHRYPMDSENAFNFRTQVLKPAADSAVYPQTAVMTAIGTLTTFFLALLFALLLESFSAARSAHQA